MVTTPGFPGFRRLSDGIWNAARLRGRMGIPFLPEGRFPAPGPPWSERGSETFTGPARFRAGGRTCRIAGPDNGALFTQWGAAISETN